MNNDITPRIGFSRFFEMNIEPRRIELAKFMGTYKQIVVTTPVEHHFQTGFKPGLCYCDDCYGDFSSARGDE